jgi:hypothetical protein
MRTFLVAVLAALFLAAASAAVLNSHYVPNSSSAVFSTPGVRI